MAKLTFTVMLGAVAVAAWLICGHYGLVAGCDFGCGQYYYTDIPNWPAYFSVKGIAENCPRWVYYALFFAWGWCMYRAWLWLDHSGDDGR